MADFFQAITSPVNLFLTVMLAGCVGYWLMVILGAFAPDALDFDLDLDADGDVDIDTGSHGGFGTTSLIKFFNIGEVPLMLLLTVFIVVLWFTGVVVHPWIGGWGLVLQLLMLIPMGLCALLATKILTQPIKMLLVKLRHEEHAAPRQFLGERCTVVSATADHKHGQAEFETGASPLRLNIRTASEHESLKRGDEAVIVADRDENGVYTVRGF